VSLLVGVQDALASEAEGVDVALGTGPGAANGTGEALEDLRGHEGGEGEAGGATMRRAGAEVKPLELSTRSSSKSSNVVEDGAFSVREFGSDSLKMRCSDVVTRSRS